MRSSGDHDLGQLENTVQLEARLGKLFGDRRWSATAIGRLRYETELEPEDEREADLRELYLTYEGRSLGVTLGRQQVVWGTTDGIRLLDVVNPLDLREFLFEDFVDIRIPLWMVNLEVYRGDRSLQVLVIPDLTFDDPADPGGAFFVPLALPGLPPSRGGAERSVAVRPVEEPENRPENWIYGLRWSARAGRWDVTANALYGWSHRPTPFLRSARSPGAPGPAGAEPTVTPRITRRRLLGFSAGRPVGPTVVRVEATWTPDAYRFALSTDGARPVPRPVRRDLLRYAVGLDWIRAGWLVSPQLFHERVLGPRGRLLDDRDTGYGTLLVEKRMDADRLTLGLFLAHGIGEPESWISPRVAYRFFGRLEVELSADLFDGDPSGIFGRFDARDRVTLSTKLHF